MGNVKFQFPSNGKAYPKSYTIALERDLEIPIVIRFNSLQTGKHIQSDINATLSAGGDNVSIPFKRESGYKVEIADDDLDMNWADLFQFPSNGKADTKIVGSYTREDEYPLFQFPSNGKADPKRPHFKPSGAVAPYA